MMEKPKLELSDKMNNSSMIQISPIVVSLKRRIIDFNTKKSIQFRKSWRIAQSFFCQPINPQNILLTGSLLKFDIVTQIIEKTLSLIIPLKYKT